MTKDRYMTAAEAAALLEVSLPTLYAYVSRGLIRSSGTSGQRNRRYYAEDIEKLLARKEGRRNPEQLAHDALHWGAPVLESALTLIDGHNLYYRGVDVRTLARSATIEQVASLLWTGSVDNADSLFDLKVQVSTRLYETMLMHLEMDGANLQPIQVMQTILPIAASDDPGAYDLRPTGVMQTGARILRLMGSVIAGDVPEDTRIAAMLQRGLRPDDPHAEAMFNAILVLCADHELNASSFTARVVASAGATPYAAVIAGLSALGGVKHGGYTERVEAFLQSLTTPADVREWMAGRLRRGEDIPGFGHKLYPMGDPRAELLLTLLQERYPNSPRLAVIQAAVQAAHELINELPGIDFALVAAAEVMGLPAGSALGLFALGRTVGWIGHAIEQYGEDRLIRPRARYTGRLPSDSESAG